jgi:hypothetical protein
VLVLRSNPNVADVRLFVAEQNRRFQKGEYGSPEGIDLHGKPLDAEKITSAAFYPSESDIGDESKATAIDLKTTKRAPVKDED